MEVDELSKEGIKSVIQDDQLTSPSGKQPKTQNAEKPTSLSTETKSTNASLFSTTNCSNLEEAPNQPLLSNQLLQEILY